MRKALIVGINYYEHAALLYGCAKDAQAVKTVLERDSNGTINFDVKLLLGTGPNHPVLRSEFKTHLRDLFAGDCETELFYFSGHGFAETTGGYLLPSDARTGDDGIPLADVLALANHSDSRNRIIVLDSCFSGIAGASTSNSINSELKEGTTILTASTANQYAMEENGAGVFTTLFVDALNGAASNLVGDVTPGSVYAHIDQSLGPWAQRPVFKTNVKSFISLRKVQPPIELSVLRRINEFFPAPGFEYRLDPTFEPELIGRPPTAPGPISANNEKFAILQKYNRVNLVVPVGAPHMWHAAMGSKACKLTVLGEHYRKLVERGRL